jgi:hypothetical protein
MERFLRLSKSLVFAKGKGVKEKINRVLLLSS